MPRITVAFPTIAALVLGVTACGSGDESNHSASVGGSSSGSVATGGASSARTTGGTLQNPSSSGGQSHTSVAGSQANSTDTGGTNATGGTAGSSPSTRSSSGGQPPGGSAASATSQATGGASSDSSGGTRSTATGGKASGGTVAATGGAPLTGGRTAGGSSPLGGTTAVVGTECGASVGPAPAVTAIAASTSVGLEWPPIAGATSYNLYWSTSPGVSTINGQAVQGVPRGYVQRNLTNGTTYYYVVTAVTAAGESVPSPEVSATPTGEWVLEQLGTGDFASIRSACPVPVVPIESRIHLLLFAEGYTSSDLPTFHAEATHATRSNDVDRWIDEVFAIEPYDLFREAFVVWYLPRASNTDLNGGDTAVEIAVSGGAVISVREAATPSWAAIATHPYAPTLFDDNRSARTAIAAFLLYDPQRKRAGVSGVTTTLSNPATTNQRIAAAFGIGHAHEFTHALSGLRDEYMETSSQAPSSWTDMSNVVGTNRCDELPWRHLLVGTPINPDTDQLVGAFGDASLGYHSELLCLMNGTHENGQFYYQPSAPNSSCSQTSCTLRSDDRMCNFCREMTSLRIFQRTGVIPLGATAGVPAWTSEYRTPFYSTYGFKVPTRGPQSNDVYPPDNGATIYEPCVP